MSVFSLEFGVTFLIFWAIYHYFRFSLTIQKLLILGFSYTFLYLATAANVGAMAVLINFLYAFFVYTVASILSQSHSKKLYLFSILAVILTLAFFKYLKFFEPIAQNLEQISDNNIFISNALPLGISYYSFMSIIYLTGVYKRKIGAQSMLDVFIYLSFFVTITCGPILAAKEFFVALNRVKKSEKFYARSAEIYTLLTLSMVKVLLIANWISKVIEPIFRTPEIYPAHVLIMGLFGFSIMLYAQFSGFIDLMRAIAAMMGFRIAKNFNRPFRAANLSEFWRRWHITLMLFFRDHLYFPLGGSRGGFWRTQRNVLIVFLVSGIWHGSGSVMAGFAVWGLLHAFGMIVCNICAKKRLTLIKSRSLRQFLTFCFVSFAWMFFGFADSDFGSSLSYLNGLVLGLSENVLNSLLVLIAAYCGLYLYNLVNFHALIKRFFRTINSLFIALFLAILAVLIYKLMPSEIPNFMYGGF